MRPRAPRNETWRFPVWEAILQGTFDIIAWLQSWTVDWGLAIIIFTLIIRLIIFPISRKQFKSNHAMQKMQPLMQELQTKYADDQQRLSEEMQKLYSEAHFNPLAGCLPMIIQMPIFLAVFQVLQNLNNYTTDHTSFFNIVPDLTVTPVSLYNQYGLTGDFVANVFPYLVLVILFSVSTLIPMLLQKNTNQQMKWMNIFMVAFMVYIGWISPGGVLLYWVISSGFGIAQQIITQKMLDKKDEELAAEVVAKPVKVNVERRPAKPRPKKKK